MEFTETEFSAFLRAVQFSARKHSNQRRKDAEASPYINHPIAVAELLWRVGEVKEMNTLIAALLHDTLEDTETGPEEIAAVFGEEVLALVQEVSDDKSLAKAERKRLQIQNAPHKSEAAKQIKLGDKISNLLDITYSPPADWNLQRRIEYLDWAQQVVEGLRGANAKLEAQFDQVLGNARQRFKEGA
jgi:GTP diphosphokinase / guanosine-3',5'-bis(diphosphate) 3'-diphosphatase